MVVDDRVTAECTVQVVLMRSVNLGNKNKVSMGDLRRELPGLGFVHYATYLQSGNLVVLTQLSAEALVSAVESMLRTKFGVETDVFSRSADSWRDLIANNPFAGSAFLVQALLLGAVPPADKLDYLLSADWGGDSLVVLDDVVYLEYRNGVHPSRMQHATILRRLGVQGTARTWRTVLGIADLLNAWPR
jgi:uncharacterized protein (DUF1697 family)